MADTAASIESGTEQNNKGMAGHLDHSDKESVAHLDAAHGMANQLERAGEGEEVTVIHRDADHTLKKNLNLVTMIALGFVITNAWGSIAASLVIGLAQGGAALLIYGYIFFAVVMVLITLNLAEMASAAPTAGGQYHWSGTFSPPAWTRQWSYITGFLNVAAWVAACAAVALIFLMGLVAYRNEGFVIQQWQLFLVFEISLIATALYVYLALDRTSFVIQLGYFLALSLFLVTLFGITCGPGSVHSHQASKAVWASFSNEVGWSNNAIVFITGLANVNFSFLSIDGAIHMAEDIPRPAYNVPRTLLITVGVGFMTAFPWIVGALYSIQDFEALATSPTAVPLFALLDQTIQNKNGVTAIMSVFLVYSFIALAACQASAARLTWSFAMDNALIGSKWLKVYNPRFNANPGAIALNGLAIFIVGCLFLASTTVYNAIVSSALILMHATFAIPAALLLWRRRQYSQRPPFYLGGFGWVCNIVTVAWSIFILIFYSFPIIMPVTGSNMNYASVVVCTVLLLAAVNWLLWGSKQYQLPEGIVAERG